MNRKNEYFIGDFIEFDRQWERSKNVGIIVKKILKSELDRKVFWFKHEYDYMVSLKEYKGDYGVVEYEDIVGEKEIPLEYKLSYIATFDSWWYYRHNSLYQKLLIDCIIR